MCLRGGDGSYLRTDNKLDLLWTHELFEYNAKMKMIQERGENVKSEDTQIRLWRVAGIKEMSRWWSFSLHFDSAQNFKHTVKMKMVSVMKKMWTRNIPGDRTSNYTQTSVISVVTNKKICVLDHRYCCPSGRCCCCSTR